MLLSELQLGCIESFFQWKRRGCRPQVFVWGVHQWVSRLPLQATYWRSREMLSLIWSEFTFDLNGWAALLMGLQTTEAGIGYDYSRVLSLPTEPLILRLRCAAKNTWWMDGEGQEHRGVPPPEYAILMQKDFRFRTRKDFESRIYTVIQGVNDSMFYAIESRAKGKRKRA